VNDLPKLYLETTIPSYLVARPSADLRLAADQSVTLEWWRLHRNRFEIFVSAIVLTEIRRGDPTMVEKREEAIRSFKLLDINLQTEELTTHVLKDVIPENAVADAAHIAIAAVHAMNFLLTWNCKHINNRYTLRRIEKCCTAAGFTCPVIATPTELMSIES